MIASLLKLSKNDIKNFTLKSSNKYELDDYGMHKIVYSLFPKIEGATRKFLFAEYQNTKNFISIMILSHDKPLSTEIGNITSKIIPGNYLDSRYYKFKIRLNPVNKLKNKKNPEPVKTYIELKKWFIDKAYTYGFEVLEDQLEITDIGVINITKKTNTITLSTATFNGLLKVTDKIKFEHAFKNGIGRAKAFGFGLLYIVPIK